MSKRGSRLTLLPTPEHMSQAEVIVFLKRQVFDDAVAAGWLSPCARKTGRGKDSIYYATRHVQDVSLRIAGGEYPVAECRRQEAQGTGQQAAVGARGYRGGSGA